MSNKKSSSSMKKPSQEVGKKPAIQQQTKPVQRPGKLGKEIDDIFGGRKKKKPEVETPVTKAKAEITNKKRVRDDNVGGFGNDPRNRPRKRTKDGLLIYTEEELGINKPNSGDTRLCPFDCQCCF